MSNHLKPPCYGCPDRKVGCHNELCPHGWAEYQRKCEEVREMRRISCDAYAARDAAFTYAEVQLGRRKKNQMRRKNTY